MKLIHCRNPFQPSIDRETFDVAPGIALRDALESHGIDPSTHVVSRNAMVLTPQEVLICVPAEEDYIVAVPDLQNPTLKAVAMIGVMAAAAYFTAGLGNFIGGTLFPAMTTATQNAIAATLITTGGTLFVNGIASLFAKKDSGASYTWDGAQTTARSGIPIPKGAGKFRAGGNIVESWVDMQNADVDVHDTDDGADKIGRQWLNLRVDFGFGPGKSLSDIRINDKDIANYADVAYKVLLGSNDQQPVLASDPDWTVLNRTTTGDTQNTAPTADFNRINNNYPITQRVRCGIARNYVIVPGRRDDTQRLEVVVQFPDGVWRYDENDVIKRAAIYYQVYYRRHGSVAWVLAQQHAYINIRQTILRQRTVIDGLPADCYDIMVVKSGSGAVDNPMDAFEHESNKWGDELWIESVQETSYTALAYPNMIQLCLRIMATDQLAGGGLQVSALVEYDTRCARPEQLQPFASDNPAVVAYDIFADPLVGAGIPDSRIDLDAFAEWAELCDSQVDNGQGGTQNLARFNGVFDRDGASVWDVFQSVCVMSRAFPQRVGTKVSVSLDRAEDPVQLFHVGNIIADSYSKEYLGLDDRANEIDVDFANAEDDYKTRTPLRIITAEDMGTSERLNKTRVNLLGCTDATQAYYWGHHKLLENKLKLRTHTWDSPVQAIACRVGNVALLQHDVPEWGDCVDVVSATANTIHVDKSDLPWSGDGGYTLSVLHPVLHRANATVEAVTGNLLTVAGYSGDGRVLRVTKGEVDVAIIKATPVAGGLLLKVEDGSTFAAGDAIDLLDIDAIETRAVAAVDSAVLTVSPAFSDAPMKGASLLYQSNSKQAIKVRISSIKRQSDQKFRITALDYTPDVYAIPAPTGDVSGGGSGVDSYRPGMFEDIGDRPVSTPDAVYTSSGGGTLLYADTMQTSDNPADPLLVTTCGGIWYGFTGTAAAGKKLHVDYTWTASRTGLTGRWPEVLVSASVDGGANWTLLSIGLAIDYFGARSDSMDLPAGLDLSLLRVKIFARCFEDCVENVSFGVNTMIVS